MLMQVHSKERQGLWHWRGADRRLCSVGVRILTVALACLAACWMLPQRAKAAPSAAVKIPVACQAPGISEAFRYCLWDSDGNLIEPRLLLQHGQEDWFTLTVTRPGRYVYTVTQEKGTDTKVIYDDTRFQAVVYVEETGNALNAQLILYRQEGGDKLSKLTFVNQKKDSGTNGSGDGSSGDGSGSGGTGDGNGPGSGPDNGGSGNGSTNGGGSGNGSTNGNGSGSFWGNGSFWGSSSGSTTGNTSGSGFWGNAFVRTGDRAPLARWAVTALAAIALAAGLLLYKRNYEMRTDRKDREDG